MQQTGEHLNVLGKNPDCFVCKVNTFGATVSSTWSGDPAIWRSDWVETVKLRFVVFLWPFHKKKLTGCHEFFS